MSHFLSPPVGTADAAARALLTPGTLRPAGPLTGLSDNAPELHHPEDRVLDDDRLEAKLDEALMQTFPASDAFFLI